MGKTHPGPSAGLPYKWGKPIRYCPTSGEGPHPPKQKRRRQRTAPLEEGRLSAHGTPAEAFGLHRFLLLVLDRMVERRAVAQRDHGEEPDHAADQDVDADRVWV